MSLWSHVNFKRLTLCLIGATVLLQIVSVVAWIYWAYVPRLYWLIVPGLYGAGGLCLLLGCEGDSFLLYVLMGLINGVFWGVLAYLATAGAVRLRLKRTS